jgi:poly(3-hydroxybutyrate) depolymerase
MTGKALIFVAVTALLSGWVGSGKTGGPEMSAGFLFKSLNEAGRELKYAVYVPRAYDPSRPWPLILFLHGSGESGTDGSRQLAQGLPRELVWNPDRWPFIVIIPQKPSQDTEWEQYDLELMTMLANARREYNVDPTRLVLTGLSQGGHGAWVLAARHPELWAAAVPVCGYGAARRPQGRPRVGVPRGGGRCRPGRGDPGHGRGSRSRRGAPQGDDLPWRGPRLLGARLRRAGAARLAARPAPAVAVTMCAQSPASSTRVAPLLRMTSA